MPKRRMTQVMGQRQRFGQILVKTKLTGQSARDLRNLKRVGQPGAVVIALVKHENLGLVLEPAKSGGMDDAVTIAAKSAPPQARRLVKSPASALAGIAAIGLLGGSHSNGHANYSTFGV